VAPCAKALCAGSHQGGLTPARLNPRSLKPLWME
jgi:hypothetical protein